MSNGDSDPLSPTRKGSLHLKASTSPTISHRPSFAENLRGVLPSPRSQRQPSLSQQALQELMNNPPVANSGDRRFVGKDWRQVKVGEIIAPEEVRFVEAGTSVEDATNLLISSGAPNVVLIRETADSRTAVGTFDYSDLNAYLLLVVGLAHPDEDHISSFKELAKKGREGKTIVLSDVEGLGRKEPLLVLPNTEGLSKAVEIFGSGIHRITIVKEGTTDVVGILTQLRLVRFFWENGRQFPAIDSLYQHSLKDLDLGTHSVFAINGDKPLTDALELMNNEGVTSLPVLDSHNNVIGNISHVDVRLLTKSTSLPLLRSSCIHFITVILSERGMEDGKDSVPVFHVNPFSTLAHTVAKLVATRSHRMWIVDAPSPASSVPPSPAATTTSTPMLPFSHNASHASPTSGPSYTPSAPSAAISAASTPGAGMSGRLSGVISLTDVLNIFARASGLSPLDPGDMRARRRRSSSSSVRKSLDGSVSVGSASAGVSRSGSVSGSRR
ncbi:hypothetical protein BJ546DRAFT_907692 [Cryomyces antarcticus]